MRPYQFINGPWENSEFPTIVRENPEGGDPHILAVIRRIHNPDALYELCRLANDAIEALQLARKALPLRVHADHREREALDAIESAISRAEA